MVFRHPVQRPLYWLGTFMFLMMVFMYIVALVLMMIFFHTPMTMHEGNIHLIRKGVRRRPASHAGHDDHGIGRNDVHHVVGADVPPAGNADADGGRHDDAGHAAHVDRGRIRRGAPLQLSDGPAGSEERGNMTARYGLSWVALAPLLAPSCALRSPFSQESALKPDAPTDALQGHVTPNTVRILGPNVYASCTAITQLTYGATHHEDRPHAVTLVRADRQADAMLAESRITHFPVNSPLLYVDSDCIPPETLAELKSFEPDGNTYDSKVQIYLVGPISEQVRRTLEDELGYKVRPFPIRPIPPFRAAGHLGRSSAHGPSRRGGGGGALRGTGYRSARHGVECAHGPRPGVRRWRGNTGGHAEDVSINLAGYCDSGLNQGYRMTWSNRDFGWGIAEAGPNYTVVRQSNWQLAVTGSLLSHMGKHGRILVLGSETLSDKLVNYMKLVQPTWGAPADQLNNHAWILGSPKEVPPTLVGRLDALLEPAEAILRRGAESSISALGLPR